MRSLTRGDRVVVPFNIACGKCHYCHRQEYSLCDNSNPNGGASAALYGHSVAGLFGYSHMLGGYPGGQAEYVRVPFADVGCLKVESELSDEQVLFLSDIFPTGYMAAENCQLEPGDTVVVWGCGPVGQFAIRSAFMLGAERVVAVDDVAERLELASAAGAEALRLESDPVFEAIDDLTAGRGADACIDAVGMEAHGVGLDDLYDRTKQALRLQTDRPTALRYAIYACKKGGVISAPGVYGGFLDKFPFGAAFAKGLTFKMGQTHVQRYMKQLLARIEAGEIDPSFVITHRMTLNQAPEGYRTFHGKDDRCIKVVMSPDQASPRAPSQA